MWALVLNQRLTLGDLSLMWGALYPYLALPELLNQGICVLITQFLLQPSPYIINLPLSQGHAGMETRINHFCFCFVAKLQTRFPLYCTCSAKSSAVYVCSSLLEQKEDLRKRLSFTTHKLELLQSEFDSTRQYLETELRRAQEELDKFTDKLRRWCVRRRLVQFSANVLNGGQKCFLSLLKTTHLFII